MRTESELMALLHEKHARYQAKQQKKHRIYTNIAGISVTAVIVASVAVGVWQVKYGPEWNHPAASELPETETAPSPSPELPEGVFWSELPSAKYGQELAYCLEYDTFYDKSEESDHRYHKKDQTTLYYDPRLDLYGVYKDTEGGALMTYCTSAELETNFPDIVNRNVSSTVAMYSFNTSSRIFAVFEMDSSKISILEDLHNGSFRYNTEGAFSGKCAAVFGDEFITEFTYDTYEIRWSRDSRADHVIAMSRNGKWGLKDQNDITLVPFVLEHIVPIDGSTAYGRWNGQYGIIDLDAVKTPPEETTPPSEETAQLAPPAEIVWSTMPSNKYGNATIRYDAEAHLFFDANALIDAQMGQYGLYEGAGKANRIILYDPQLNLFADYINDGNGGQLAFYTPERFAELLPEYDSRLYAVYEAYLTQIYCNDASRNNFYEPFYEWKITEWKLIADEPLPDKYSNFDITVALTGRCAAAYGGRLLTNLTYKTENTWEVTYDAMYVDPTGSSENIIALCKDGKWGALDKDGNIVVPFVLEHILPIDDHSAFGRWSGQYGIIDLDRTRPAPVELPEGIVWDVPPSLLYDKIGYCQYHGFCDELGHPVRVDSPVESVGCSGHGGTHTTILYDPDLDMFAYYHADEGGSGMTFYTASEFGKYLPSSAERLHAVYEIDAEKITVYDYNTSTESSVDIADIPMNEEPRWIDNYIQITDALTGRCAAAYGSRFVADFIYETSEYRGDPNCSANALVALYKDGKYGVLDKDGNIVVPFVLEYIMPINDTTVFGCWGGHYGIINVDMTARASFVASATNPQRYTPNQIQN